MLLLWSDAKCALDIGAVAAVTMWVEFLLAGIMDDNVFRGGRTQHASMTNVAR